MDVPANFRVTSDMWWKLCCGFPFGFVFLKLLLPLMNMESGLHVNTLGFVKVCSPWWCPTRCYGAGQDPCNSPPWEIVTPWRHCRIYSFIMVIRVSLSRVPLLCWPFTLLEPFDSPWSCVLFQGVPCDMLMSRSLVHETLPESFLWQNSKRELTCHEFQVVKTKVCKFFFSLVFGGVKLCTNSTRHCQPLPGLPEKGMGLELYHADFFYFIMIPLVWCSGCLAVPGRFVA